MEDVDAPMGKPFVHLVALVDPSVTSFAPGALNRDAAPDGVRLLKSGFGRGYVGPSPIKGHGPHHYVFQLFALPAPVAANPDASPRAVLAAVRGPVLARARLTGTYER